MKRIAVWYESSLGRNDGNPLYVTAHLKRAQYFCDVELKRNQNNSLLGYFPAGRIYDPFAQELAKWILTEVDPEGIEVQHLRPYGDCSEFGNFDLNIWVDWGEDGLKGLLPYEPQFPRQGIGVYWASDTHLGFDYRLETARKFDVVFVAQKRAVEEFKQAGVDATWLPHAFEPLAYPKFDLVSKKHDICFVGHVNNQKRIDMLDRAFAEAPNFYYGRQLFEKAARKYAESKITINCAMIDDLNMRTFEVLGSGNFLLTDDIPLIHDLFEDKKHLALYTNLDDMAEKIRYYLNHEDERLAIAKAGYEEAISKHTIYHRVRKMLAQAFSMEEVKC